MKTKWVILLLVLGLLFFGLGCLADSVAVEGIGGGCLFSGIDGVDGEDLAGGGEGGLDRKVTAADDESGVPKCRA